MMDEKTKVNKKTRTQENSGKMSTLKGDSNGNKEGEDFLETSVKVSSGVGSKGRTPTVKRKAGEKVTATLLPTQEVDESLLLALNNSADLILECLPPGLKADFHTACYKDFFMKDIGLYVLGLLNRMYKMGDYYNPDIEPEWDRRIVGISKNLKCNYCSKEIPNPQNINQLFCCNLCAKRYREKDKTGVIFPGEKDLGSEADQDAKAWEKEQERLGVE